MVRCRGAHHTVAKAEKRGEKGALRHSRSQCDRYCTLHQPGRKVRRNHFILTPSQRFIHANEVNATRFPKFDTP
ncbi:unnamed protein product [Stenotrophomonas maltophilia]|nr:unnamed protein product [Stenotrophomonas maltophilia]